MYSMATKKKKGGKKNHELILQEIMGCNQKIPPGKKGKNPAEKETGLTPDWGKIGSIGPPSPRGPKKKT